MGPGTGILALADYLDLPELYKSYGDTHWDRLTNPNMLLDPVKMGGNLISDLASFIPDVVGDIPAAAIDRFTSADYYNPFSEYAYEHGMNVNPKTGEKTLIPGIDFQDFTTQLGRYELDALPWNPMPSFYTEEQGGNPLDPKVGERVFKDIEKMTADHFDKEASYLDKDGDGVIDSIHDKLEENLPPYWKWAYDNPEKDREDYYDLHSKEYEKEYNKIFPEKERKEFFKKKADEVFQSRYGIDNPYGFTFGKEQPWVGPGLREFDLEGINIPFTDKYDIPFQYGHFGDPIFKYSTPEAKDTYTKMNIIGEMLYGVPSALRWIGKKLARKAGDVKPPKNAGRIEDKDRFRQAEEWLNRRGG